jgi:hypothetical protein
MSNLDNLDKLFVFFAFLFQIVLIIHFALRKWQFDIVMRYGWIVYALGVLAVIVSVILLLNGKHWTLWVGGFIYLIWAILGFTVEYGFDIEWRNPPQWSIFIPYVILYLGTIMFYWFPLGTLYKPLWYIYAVLFIISTGLNVTSHKQ